MRLYVLIGQANRKAIKTVFQLFSCLLLLLLVPSVSGLAQEYPNFSPQPAMQDNNQTPARGVELVTYSSVLYGFYSNATWVNWTYSLDGVTYNGQGEAHDENTGQFFQVDCNALYGDSTCAVSAVAASDGIYLAFAEFGNHNLDIVKATLAPGPGIAFNFNLIQRVTSVSMTSAPGIIIFNNKLMINYGVSNDPSGQKNVGYMTMYDFGTGTWSTQKNGTYLPTKVGMVIFNGNLYEFSKQNNSDNHIEVVQIDGNGMSIPSTWYQMSSNYQISSGITATVFNGNIVFAARDNGAGEESIYSSPDGVTWYSTSYPNLLVGSTPGLALFNGGLANAFKANDSRYLLFSTFASQ